MEPAKEQSTAPTQAEPSSDDGQSLLGEPQRTTRYGIDSRNTVLQQFRERSDVIMLDSDDEPDHSSLALVTERQTGSHPSIIPSTGAQVIERCTLASSLPQAKVKGHEASRENVSKRRLFSSANAKENMYKISGLPSPPNSDKDSPQSSLGSAANGHSNNISWSFENLEIQQTEHQGQEWRFDAVNAGELSMRLARLVNPDAAAESTPSISSVQPLPAPENSPNAKDAIEAKGIARSRQLRAKKEAQEVDEQLPSSKAAHSVPQPTADAAYKIPKARENQWEDMEDLSPGETGRQLDDAMNLVKENRRHIEVKSTQPKRKHDKHKNCRNREPNPYSRQAADQYRTQSRYIDHNDEDAAFAWKILANNDRPDVVSEEEQRRREERLMRMKVKASGGVWDPSPKPAKIVPASKSAAKFYAPFNDKPTSKHKGPLQPPQKQTRDALRELMGTFTSQESNNMTLDNKIDSDVDETGDPSNSTSTSQPVPTLSALEKLSALKPVANKDVENSSAIEDRYATLPPRGEDLTLPKNIATMSESRQGLIIKRETLKERRKDLNAILEVYKAFATLLAVKELRDIDVKQLGEVKKYTEAVLDRDRSGKSVRKRMMDIRDNIRRRLQTRARDVDERAVDVQLQGIMLARYYKKLQKEMTMIPTELGPVKNELDKYNKALKEPANKLWKSKIRAQGSTRGSAAMSLLTEPERYYRSVEEKIEQHRAQIALFEKGNASATAAEGFGGPEIVDVEDDESVISEEDAVDAFMKPRGPTEKTARSSQEDLLIEEINHAENEGQEKDTVKETAASGPTQAADMSLLQQMAAKAAQEKHAASQGVQKRDTQILHNMRLKKAARAEQKKWEEDATAAADAEEPYTESVEEDAITVKSPHEFDDSELDEDDEEEAEEEEDQEGQPVCKRYIVKASITGISPQHDADEHLIGRFLSRKNAMRKVLEIAPWMKMEHLKRNPDSESTYSITLKDGQGEYEQQMTLGHDKGAGCRTWIEEEMYNPSEEAYENAKVYRACQPQEAWFVDWERTIKPVLEEDEDGVDGEMQDADQVEEQSPIENTSEPVAISDAVEQQEFTSAGTKNVADCSPQTPTMSAREEHPDSTVPNMYDSADLSPSAPSTNNDDDDDLFGPDPGPNSQPSTLPSTPPISIPELPASISNLPDKAEAPTITRATGDHLRIFSNLAMANRHAKDVFMRWFIDHLRGSSNLGYIKGEDEGIEEELRGIGDRAAWSREEQFDMRGDNGVLRNDRFKVWVRKARSSGPAN